MRGRCGFQERRTATQVKRDILVATRQYAKRQLTWFAREPNLQTVMLTGIRPFPLRCCRFLVLKASHLTSPPPGNERALLVGPGTAGRQQVGPRGVVAGTGRAGEERRAARWWRRRSSGGPRRRRPITSARARRTELAELCKKENVGTVIFNDELSPGAEPQPGKDFRAEDSRPDAADSRYFRAAGEVEGRQAADRAGAVAISAAAADRHVDPLVAAERRHRDAGSGRNAAGGGPPARDGKDRAAVARAGRGAPAAGHAARRAGCGSTGRSRRWSATRTRANRRC